MFIRVSVTYPMVKPLDIFEMVDGEHENRIPSVMFSVVKMVLVDCRFKVSVPRHENCNRENFPVHRSVVLAIAAL